MRKALVLFALTAAAVFPALGQDRMPMIPNDQLTGAQKKAIEERRAAQQPREEACRKGEIDPAKCTQDYYGIHGPMVPLVRSPEVMLAANSMLNYLEFHTALPANLREMVILIAARELTQQYLWNAHYATALKTGVRPEWIAAISEGRRPEGMSEDEEMVYNFCEELRKNHGVSDRTYAKVAGKFGEQGVIDLVSVYGVYSYVGAVMNVARTPRPKAASAPLLAPLPN